MRVTDRRRLRVAGLSVILTAASALTVPLMWNPANAATAPAVASRPTFSHPPVTLAPGTYTWRTNNGSTCLGYDPDHRGQAWQWDCHDNSGGLPAPEFMPDYQWRTVNVGGNNFEIINSEKNQCLSVDGASMNDNAALFILNCTGASSQIFTAVAQPVRPTAYQLVNVNSGKCVAVGGGSRENGAYVLQSTCSTSPWFLWSPYVLTTS